MNFVHLKIMILWLSVCSPSTSLRPVRSAIHAILSSSRPVSTDTSQFSISGNKLQLKEKSNFHFLKISFVCQVYHQPPLQQVISPSVFEQSPVNASQTGSQAPPLGEGEVAAPQTAAPPQVEGGLDQPDAGGNPVRPNVVLNANAGPLGAIADDEEEGFNGERDILDWLYIATRVLMLFSIVYLYSSFSRFLLVAGVALIVYLYQVQSSYTAIPNNHLKKYFLPFF